LKIELVYRNSWRTRDQADNASFGYIDGWYIPRTHPKDLSWLSPDEYETAHRGRLGPLAGDQSPVPSQKRARGDQAGQLQRFGQYPRQRGQYRSIGPVEAVGWVCSCHDRGGR